MTGPQKPGPRNGRLAEMLRVDHAGEYGAVAIYRGQRAVFDRLPHKAKTAALLKEMEEGEHHHLPRVVVHGAGKHHLAAVVGRALGDADMTDGAARLLGHQRGHDLVHDVGIVGRPDGVDVEDVDGVALEPAQ